MCLFLKNEISLKVNVSDFINSITLQHETFHQEKKRLNQNQPYTLIIQIKKIYCFHFSISF